MYNVVDTYYAGDISETALAAVGLSFPVFLLVIAASSGLSRGASGLISNAIGARKYEDQQRFTTQSVSLANCLSMVLTFVGLMIASPIFQFLGAEGEFLEMANAYITPIFLGASFFIVGGVCNAILTSSGDTKTFGSVLVVGFFLNLVFDPWFKDGGWGLPAMGVAGIAWATVLIQFLGSSFLMWSVIRRGLLKVNDFRAYVPDLKTWWEITVQALPATFNIFSIAIGFFAINWFLKRYGVDAVAAYTATTRIEQIALMPTFGLYAAIMALVGQNNGAGKISRVRETMWFCNWVGVTVNLVMAGLMFLFSRELMGIFTDDQEVIEYGVTCLNVIAPIHWSYILTATHIAMLQALKRPSYGFFEAIARKIIIPLPILWVLVVWLGKDIEWIWYCNAAINVLMTAVTVLYARKVLNELSA
ncbi:Multidrug export protein MepA [Mariniblastus fucicola]|uniref:Multidrug export protein MepA n=2 Tax=Mariniblastus fucicola TaxID=980251 RepID=A0A5B9PH70_9BACT|nr:Multidrug export protein MepA [Mariniblastus fucicola]